MPSRSAWLGLGLLALGGLVAWLLHEREPRVQVTAEAARAAQIPQASLPAPVAHEAEPLAPVISLPPGVRLQFPDGRAWHEEVVHVAVLARTDARRSLDLLPLETLQDVVWWSGELSADGRLQFPELPEHGWVQASSASWRAAPLLLKPGIDAALVMEPVSILHGRVAQRDGHALPGAWVMLHAGGLGEAGARWSLGDAGLDRRVPLVRVDEGLVFADAEGVFSLPHAPGLLVVAHPDAQPGLAWPGPGPCDVKLDEGAVLTGRIVGPDGGPPSSGDELVVTVVEGLQGSRRSRPFLVQRLAPDSAFTFRVAGLGGGTVSAKLETADRAVLDHRGTPIEEHGTATLVLHFSESSEVTIRIPGSHAALSRIDLKRVDEPGPDEGRETWHYMKRTERIDEWRRRVGWRGPTDVIANYRDGPDSVIARVVLDEAHEFFDFGLGGGRLFVSVVAPAEALPAIVRIRKEGSNPNDASASAEMQVPRSGEEVVIEHLSAGSWLLEAGPAGESAWAAQGARIFALGTAAVVDGQDTHVVLSDSSRPLDILVLDEEGRPCPGIPVGCGADSDAGGGNMAFFESDEAGLCHLRVAGPGPFSVYAYDRRDASRIVPTTRGVWPEAGLLAIRLQRVAIVTFEVGAAESGGSEPANLRIRGIDGPTSFDAEVPVEDGHSAYPIRLGLGAWMIQLLDADGRAQAERTVTLREPGEQALRLGD